MMTFGEYNVRGYHTVVIGDFYEVQGFATLRPCPTCGKRLRTQGHGQFFCLGCGYEDKQDVEPLLKAGLDYPFPSHGKHLNMFFGYR